MDEKEKKKQEHMMAIRTEIDTNKASSKKGRGSRLRGKNKPSVSIRFKTAAPGKEKVRRKGRKKKKSVFHSTPDEIVVVRSFLSFLMAFLPALVSHPKILRRLTKMIKEEVKDSD